MKGILVASDCKQEWLLPWWWKHYSAHNSYPVAFFDLGMTPVALKWCRERGEVYSLPNGSALKKIPPAKIKKWGKRYGDGIWLFRDAWFRKPLVLLNTPFEVSCWLDLDCQVLGSLKPLFDSLDAEDVAMVKELGCVQQLDREQSYIFPDEVNYNSGVVLFRRGAKFLHYWVQMCADENNRFLGDQNVLSRVLYLYDIPVKELPRQYNWAKLMRPDPDALIIHYSASAKLEIIEQLKIKPTDSVFLSAEI